MGIVDQMLTLMAWTVGVIGVGVAVIALFHDRARGRRRCSRCWYDMAATPVLRCPECGRTARRESHLHRTRRHWRSVILGLAIVGLGALLARAPVMRRHGWRAGLPSSLLVYLTPTIEEEAAHVAAVGAGGPPHPVTAELQRRLDDGGFTSREWSVIFRRSGALRTRDRWPIDRPLVVEMRLPYWLAGQRDISLHEIQETDKGPQPWRIFGQATALRWYVGALDPGARDAPLKIDLSPTPGALPGALGATVAMRLPVRAVQRPEDAMDPVSSPELLEQIRTALTVQLAIGGDERAASYGVSVHLDRTKLKLPPHLAVALGVVVEREGGARTEMHELSAVGTSADAIHYCYFDTLPVNEVADAERRKLWIVRIIGTPGGALTDWKKTSYWHGEITLRLSDLPVVETRPARRF